MDSSIEKLPTIPEKLPTIKELELENLASLIKESRMSKMKKGFAYEAIEELQQALTPPTAEEVCEALSEYMGRKVIYVSKQFYVAKNDCKNCNIYNYLDINSLKDAPHLITLIGRFYEGLK